MAKVSALGARNINGYMQLLQEAHERIGKMEEHLAEQVLMERQRQARVEEEEIAYVRASGKDSGFFIPPELLGEFTSHKRIALAPNTGFVVGTTQIYYLFLGSNAAQGGVPDPRTFVESIITDTLGYYSDGFANDLYVPEGQGLWIVNPTPQGITVNVTLQARRYKPTLALLSQEESYALAEGFDGYLQDGSDPELENSPVEIEPEDHMEIDEKRTEPVADERPQPHFAEAMTNIDTVPMHGEEDLR